MAVLNAEGLRLGYVPRKVAAEVAARLKAGEALEARVAGTLEGGAGETEGLVFTGFIPGDPRLELVRVG